MSSRKTSNALTPLYPFLAGGVALLCFAIREFEKHPTLAGILFGLGGFAFLFFPGIYVYLLIKQPHRLQSEWFQTRQLGLEFIQAKDSKPVDPNLVKLLAERDSPPKQALPSIVPKENESGQEEK